MNKLLTIVIPAYNMEKYLKRCLDSILCEEIMDKVEVFIINDGSKDKTLEIAKDYENRYPDYYHAIDKLNGNYGSCMNKGLSLANGKYFRTLDADDWFDTNNFIRFVKDLENTDADMLLCEYLEFYETDKETKLISLSDDMKPNQDLSFNCQIWNCKSFLTLSQIWGNVYKTELIRKSNLHWDEGVFYTDNEYNFWPIKYVSSVRFISYPIYIYLIGREGQSVSKKIQKRNFHSYEIVANSMVDELLTRYDETNNLSKIQLLMVARVLGPFYSRLLDFGYSIKTFQGMNQKLKSIPEIFDFYANRYSYRNINYIKYADNYLRITILRILHKLDEIKVNLKSKF